MDVGVIALLVVEERVKNHSWLLRGGGIVEIDERTALDLLVDDREILAQGGPVYGLAGMPRGEAPASSVVFDWRAISHFGRSYLVKGPPYYSPRWRALHQPKFEFGCL